MRTRRTTHFLHLKNASRLAAPPFCVHNNKKRNKDINNFNNIPPSQATLRMSTPTPPPPPEVEPSPPEFDKDEAAFLKATTAAELASAIFKGRSLSGSNQPGNLSDDWTPACLEVRKKFEAHHPEASDPFTAKWTAALGGARSLQLLGVRRGKNDGFHSAARGAKPRTPGFSLALDF